MSRKPTSVPAAADRQLAESHGFGSLGTEVTSSDSIVLGVSNPADRSSCQLARRRHKCPLF